MEEKINREQYVSLRPDVELNFTQFQEAKVFLDHKEIADIELDAQSHPVFLLLLPWLDGTKTVQEIITILEPEGITEETILSCLDFLRQSGFIFQFSRAQDIYQASNYAWRNSNPQKILDRIAKAKVFLQGQESFCHLIAEALKGAGVESEQIFSAFIDCSPKDNEWKVLASEADLIILFGEPWEQVEAVNSWCVKHHKPLMVGWWQGFQVSFGPILVPGVTACQSCIYELPGNVKYPNISRNNYQAGSFPMVLAAASLLAGICVEFLSGASLSRTLTSVHEINLRHASFTNYPVLKNPRCRLCSRLKTWPEGAVIDA